MEKVTSTQRGRGGYLEALLHGCPDAILAIDAEGKITFANQFACELTKREMHELVGQNITIVYSSNEAARETNRKLYLSGGVIHDHESTVKTERGKIIPVRISASHLKSSSGDYAGAVGYFQTYRPWTDKEAKTKAYTEELEAALEEWKDIGAPIYELFPGLSYVVIVGRLDSNRLSKITNNLLSHIKTNMTEVVRIDLSVALIENAASVASELIRMIRCVRLLGTESIVTGIETSLVMALETLEIDVSVFKSFSSRNAAFIAALDIVGYEVHKKEQG
jgi:rsbT co-antagonist protein RsbR